jgi:choline dehydrogenase-like flavoprotein/antitoxin component YwqK of YwqJK toxin-antitoxin module
MRCRDGEGGAVVREQELQGGAFRGAVRYYKDGQLEKDYRVNERGNRDGVAREYARGDAGAKPVLVREETYRDGRTVGLARSWYPSGQLRRVSFHGDDDREQASAEFTSDGKLSELRCAPRAVLGGDADDARWCGHAGAASNVVLYSGKGVAKARVSYERGERRRSELLGEGGAVREVQEASAERRRRAIVLCRRRQAARSAVGRRGGERAGRVVTLDQEFHESGKLVRERRWRVVERGGELASEQHWYLNGQPKDRVEYVVAEGRRCARRRRTTTTARRRSKAAGAPPPRPRAAASRDRRAPELRRERAPARRAPLRRARPAHARARARRQRQRRPRRRGLRGRLAQGVRQMIDREDFDYVIVGGGSAGCVLAARLSENPFVRVCLLEAGPADKSVAHPLPRRPRRCWPRTAPTTGASRPSPSRPRRRRGYQPRGKVLGGSSSVNAMIYVRGQPEDYDGWASEGNPGWAGDDVLPYFRRAEHNERGGDAFHGEGGPLNVMDLAARIASGRSFVEAARQAGHAVNADFNGERQEGVGLYQVTHKNGERFSAAKAYLTPHLARTNLHVITGATATRIRLDGVRATGVEIRVDGVRLVRAARREVLLAAGALQSPQLLMLSGIGPGEHLRSLGIEVRHDLPGVGRNLHDHVDVVAVLDAPHLTDLFGLSLRGAINLLKGVFEWRRRRTGMLTTNFAEAAASCAAIRPSTDRTCSSTSSSASSSTTAGRRCSGTATRATSACCGRRAAAASRWRAPTRRRRRASTRTSSPSATTSTPSSRLQGDAPRPRPARRSPATARASWRRRRRRGATPRSRPSSAATPTRLLPPVGTCRMGMARSTSSTHELRVRGVVGLRVVDASIMPSIVSGKPTRRRS